LDCFVLSGTNWKNCMFKTRKRSIFDCHEVLALMTLWRRGSWFIRNTVGLVRNVGPCGGPLLPGKEMSIGFVLKVLELIIISKHKSRIERIFGSMVDFKSG
jgi:hypothetical protein